MRILDIITAKRDGFELKEAEISNIVLGYAAGKVPDYQMSAFLMAIYFRGMTFKETSAMTRAMVQSGSVIDLSSIEGIKVDKHSTGGVGDKTTLVIVPLLAACGLKVAKMSGRGLGFTGGTLDKLESIPGFNTALDMGRFISQVNEIGAAIAGQTTDIVPADKNIYSLRDVTATVESIPLVAASVMSKKIACGSDVILLDVKTGTGAFAGTLDEARELARTMVAIGESFGKKVSAVITDMNQPLGSAVGNSLEIREAIDTLKGNGPEDFKKLCIELSAIMLFITGQAVSIEQGRAKAAETIQSGAALEAFRRIIKAQGGNSEVIDNSDILPAAKHQQEVTAETGGVVSTIDCAGVGIAASMLGAGRERKEDNIDPAAGIMILKKLGKHVKSGEPVAIIHTNDENKITAAKAKLLSSYTISDSAEVPPLVYDLIGIKKFEG